MPTFDSEHYTRAADALTLELGWVERGDLICVVAGTPFYVPGKTDLIKLHHIGEE